MSDKVKVNLTIDRKVVEKSKEIGLNISQFCENALKEAIEALEQRKHRTETNGGLVDARSASRTAKNWCSGRDLNPGRLSGTGHATHVDIQSLEEFEKFCKVDLRLAKKTVWRYVYEMKKFFKWCGRQPVTRALLRDYLEPLEVEPRNTALKAFRRFFRDFVGIAELVSSFRFVKTPPKLRINLPTKEDLRRAFETFETLRDKTLFVIYASSGLRRQEVLDLTFDDIDFDKRMLVPNHNSRTKHTYVSFYNEEAEKVLREYLEQNHLGSKLFPVTWNAYLKAERKVCNKTGIKVNPQILREWFCNEMGRLGVPDRYIDAFCGRVPRSILARHYTDYSPERLKQIYEKANLKVLA